MKADKKEKSVIAIYAIILFVYVLTFVILPFKKILSSWIVFAFTVAAILGSLVICGVAFRAKNTLVSKLYGFPIFKVGVWYALIQLLTGIVICVIGAFAEVPYWVALLISVVLMGAAAIGVIVTDNARDIVESIDDNDKENTQSITLFQLNIAGIVDSCEISEVRSELEKLNAIFMYSDPVTNDSTKDIENQIKTMISDLDTFVTNGNVEESLAQIKNLTKVLSERNRLCKATK